MTEGAVHAEFLNARESTEENQIARSPDRPQQITARTGPSRKPAGKTIHEGVQECLKCYCANNLWIVTRGRSRRKGAPPADLDVHCIRSGKGNGFGSPGSSFQILS